MNPKFKFTPAPKDEVKAKVESKKEPAKKKAEVTKDEQ